MTQCRGAGLHRAAAFAARLAGEVVVVDLVSAAAGAADVVVAAVADVGAAVAGSATGGLVAGTTAARGERAVE